MGPRCRPARVSWLSFGKTARGIALEEFGDHRATTGCEATSLGSKTLTYSCFQMFINHLERDADAPRGT